MAAQTIFDTIFMSHVKRFGNPVTIPGKSGQVCSLCNGAGLLPGSTLKEPKPCISCNAYGRLMTLEEENEFRESFLFPEEEYACCG